MSFLNVWGVYWSNETTVVVKRDLETLFYISNYLNIDFAVHLFQINYRLNFIINFRWTIADCSSLAKRHKLTSFICFNLLIILTVTGRTFWRGQKSKLRRYLAFLQLTTNWQQTENKLTSYWQQTNNKLTTNWLQTDYKLTTNWQQTDNKLTTNWQQTNNKLTSYWREVDLVLEQHTKTHLPRRFAVRRQ